MLDKFKIFSIFTGGGGGDIGFKGGFDFLDCQYDELPFETEVAIDLNPFACNTLQTSKYFKDTKEIVCADITKHDYTKYKTNYYDVLIGGFPCVTFSAVGKQQGIADDINGKLYETYANFVEHLRPKVFLAENVKGILSANKGEAIKIIKKRFEIDGYRLKIYLANFADFGVPQLRERVLFIGVRNDIQTDFIAPEYTHKGKHLTALEAFKKIDNQCPNNNLMRIAEKTKQMLETIPEGGNFKDASEGLRVKGLMSNIYRRLDRNKPAYTVIASGGGGTWTYHFEEHRPLTNRERARLQGFPDDHIFQGNNTEARRQIGNAIPAVGLYPFAKRIALLLQGKEPECVNADACIKEINIL
jgi:DNA (cytosine-5)-methyltransferase 1